MDQSLQDQIQTQKIYYLRQVKVEVKPNEKYHPIQLTEESGIYKLNEKFYDYVRLANDMEEPRDEIKDLVDSFEYMKQYNLNGVVYKNERLISQKNNYATVIRKIYSNIP